MALGSEPLPNTSGQHSHGHSRTPLEAILDAAAQCEAAGFDEVLIIYNTRDGKSGSYDSGLTASETGFLCDLFKAWLIGSNLNVLQGQKAADIENIVFNREGRNERS